MVNDQVCQVCQKVVGSAHCKVKSSDDIIINVLETDGRFGGILDQDVIHYDTWVRKHS